MQTVPEGPRGWIQWKGTEVCMDVYCSVCGEHSHIDAEFAYNVMCPHCGTVYMCNGNIQLIPLDYKPEGRIVTEESDDLS